MKLAALLAALMLVIAPSATATTPTYGIGTAVTVHHLKHPAGYPPYWRKDPPKWCYEDMPCWIGSGADGRSAQAALNDWTHQMHIAQDDQRVVGVFLQDSDTNGDPLYVEVHSITHLSRCTGHGTNETCQARLDGYNRRVFVAGVDFPHAKRYHR